MQKFQVFHSLFEQSAKTMVLLGLTLAGETQIVEA
jgi:hypothetical protein